MEPFITFRENNKDGVLSYFILQREYPHFVGMVVDRPRDNKIQAPIAGHNLWVEFYGTVRGAFIPALAKTYEDMCQSARAMADWYHANRIETNLSKYKKWRNHATGS